ncbi:hypothetical protein F441_06893 [Phytophthora nicotianae CJ01A1]|uniref:Uncharacterized protein n=1 Tax=Phytophthora nicotianae CJ01A1 TaxID=1317063 RepID=W2X807_PHYNI|nr:hypothetical protein F441_06893 [Phytophthora nicotianae CJ01A1]
MSVSSTPPPPLTPRAPRRDRVAAPGGRGARFGADELQSFLETLEEHLPLGRDEWELVVSIHIRKVRTAKRVHFLMAQRADIGEGDHISETDIGAVAGSSQNQSQQVPPISGAPTERSVAQSASGQPATAGLGNVPELTRATGSSVPRPLINGHRKKIWFNPTRRVRRLNNTTIESKMHFRFPLSS